MSIIRFIIETVVTVSVLAEISRFSNSSSLRWIWDASSMSELMFWILRSVVFLVCSSDGAFIWWNFISGMKVLGTVAVDVKLLGVVIVK